MTTKRDSGIRAKCVGDLPLVLYLEDLAGIFGISIHAARRAYARGDFGKGIETLVNCQSVVLAGLMLGPMVQGNRLVIRMVGEARLISDGR